jgi:DNA-binding NarL/FixJ family response regulator
MPKKIKILLVEDHQLVREAWGLMLSSYTDFLIIGEVDDLDNLVSALHQHKPDIILLDINLKGKLSIDYVPIICSILPNPKIIAVSMNVEYFIVKKMFQLGVKGYISKSSSSKELIEGIRTIYEGNTYTSPDITRVIKDNSDSNKTELKFSSKDLTIIKLIADGFSNKEMSSKLEISEKAVEARKTTIFKKAIVKNSAELVNFATKNGIL